MSVAIVRTGVANTASVLAGFGRLGVEASLTDDPAVVRDATHVVLPGVGSFACGMEALRCRGLDRALVERVRAGRPTLAVCLGLQLLCESSSESPEVNGLGVIAASVGRFDDSVRVPQFGWNTARADPSCRVLTDGCAYFANSYRLAKVPDGWSGAVCEYGGRFVAALERGTVVACQFHPELSGPWGLELLSRWLARAGEGAACC